MSPARLVFVVLFGTAGLLGPASAVAQSTPPASTAVHPALASVVEVESQGIKGHGVVLTDSGLILTSFRLVAGGIDVKVHLSPHAGGVEVPDVQVLKVHPKYDLALLQGKAPFGGRFAPATVVPKGGNAEAGLRCHVITSAAKDAPPASALHATVVTSPDRVVEGLSYIQLGLGEDFTGAPVCDERGRVFAIATRTLEQSPDIGLAISTQKLVMADFVAVKDRTSNTDLAIRSSQAAVEAANLARQSGGGKREELLHRSITLSRFTLIADPQEPIPYRNIGLDWEDLGQPLISRRWYEEGLRMAPGDVSLMHNLGVSLVTVEPKDRERAVALWRAALAAPPDQQPVEMCTHDLAAYALNMKRPAAAAYMLSWGFSISVKTPRTSPSDGEMRQEIQRMLPANEQGEISRHEGPFTLAVYDDLMAGTPFSEAVKKVMLSSNPVPGAATGPTGVKVNLPDAQEILRQQTIHAAKFQPQLTALPAAGQEFPLPSNVRQVLPASSGWQTLFVFGDFGKIGVFNMASGKFDGFIDCPDPAAQCAAGGNVVAIYSPSSGMLDLHDLTTLQKTASHKLTLKGPVKYIGLGLYNEKQLFAVYDDDDMRDPASGEFRPALVNLSNMEISYPPVQRRLGGNRQFNSHPGKVLEANMDETGAICSMCCTQVTSSQSPTMTIQPDGRVIYDIRPQDLRDSRPSHAGLALVTQDQVMLPGEELDALSKADPTLTGRSLLAPITGYPGLVRLMNPSSSNDPKGFRVYGLPALTPVREICLQPANLYKLMSDYNGDQRRIVASYAPDRMAYLLFETKKGRLLPLGLKGDQVTAIPGKKLVRQLDIPLNTPATLKEPRPGMTYDPTTSTLTWEVPADTQKNQAITLLIQVHHSKRNSDFYREMIRVQ
jgi:hypothetical protein